MASDPSDQKLIESQYIRESRLPNCCTISAVEWLLRLPSVLTDGRPLRRTALLLPSRANSRANTTESDRLHRERPRINSKRQAGSCPAGQQWGRFPRRQLRRSPMPLLGF